jgi:hypothetical protein
MLHTHLHFQRYSKNDEWEKPGKLPTGTMPFQKLGSIKTQKVLSFFQVTKG